MENGKWEWIKEMSFDVLEKIEEGMRESEMSWRKLEVEIEGGVTRGLKRKVMFNVAKLNKILNPLGLELDVINFKKSKKRVK